MAERAKTEYKPEQCPYAGPQCMLVNNGKKEFVCFNCHTAFFVSTYEELVSFDWHGPFPWEQANG